MLCVQSRFLQLMLRTLCVLGVGMIMGDGVLTRLPSLSSLPLRAWATIPGGRRQHLERSEWAQSQRFQNCQCCAFLAKFRRPLCKLFVLAASSYAIQHYTT